jgi:hypothetical protein
MEEPLPCPFCGEDVAPNEHKFIDGHIHYYLTCWNDDCEVNPEIKRPSHSKEEIICKWNKRKEN